jgi:alpha-galactosidase
MPTLPVERVDPYALRSAMCCCPSVGFDMPRRDLDFTLLRRLTEEWRQIAEYYYGDYYPLTPYERAGHSWMVWQFHLPERDGGLVQVFRREQSPYETARFRLKALGAGVMYEVRDFDEEEAVVISGGALMKEGLFVAMPSQPQARTITYQRKSHGNREAT